MRRTEEAPTITRIPVASSGERWRARRHEERESEIKSHTDALGAEYLRLWDRIQPDFAERHRIPAAIAEDMAQRARILFEHEYGDVVRNVRTLAVRGSLELAGELERYFRHALGSGDDASSRLHRKNAKLYAWDLMQSIARKKPGRAAKQFLDPSLLAHFLSFHNERMRNAEALLKPELERLRQQTRAQMMTLAERGLIPLDPTIAAERIDAAELTIVDDLVARLDEKWGDYDAERHRIRVSTGVPESEWRRVIAHELFHAVSGQFEVIEALIDEDEEDADFEEEQRGSVKKIGTHVRKGALDEIREALAPKVPMFYWLNEAMTEKLTGSIVGKEVSYRGERELLAMLIEHGIQSDILLAAYFENYRGVSGEHHLPNTRELFRHTNARFGRGFLVALDLLVRRKGPEYAAALWRERGDEFAEVVRREAYREHVKS